MGVRLSWSLLAIVVIALFLGAMRGTSAAVEETTVFLVYFGYVALTLLAMLAGRKRPGLLGFVVFGWASFLPTFAHQAENWASRSPTKSWVEALASATNSKPPLPPGYHYQSSNGNDSTQIKITNDAGDPPPTGYYVVRNRGKPVLMPNGMTAVEFVASYNQAVIRATTVGLLLVNVCVSFLGLILGVLFGQLLREPKSG